MPSTMPESIKAVSISRLHKYESCPRAAFFAYVDKVPEPVRPPELGEAPNTRGDRVHKACEDYVHGRLPAPPHEARHFQAELDKAQALVKAQRAATEEWWLFDRAWAPLDQSDLEGSNPPAKGRQIKSELPPPQTHDPRVWARVRTDLRVWLNPTHLLIVDYKTGARFGNEIKHADQTNSYMVSGFVRYPRAMTVSTELWYLDHELLVTTTTHRHQYGGFHLNLTRRYEVMCADTVFKPKPSNHACRFCSWKTGLIGKGPMQGTGHCRLNPI